MQNVSQLESSIRYRSNSNHKDTKDPGDQTERASNQPSSESDSDFVPERKRDKKRVSKENLKCKVLQRKSISHPWTDEERVNLIEAVKLFGKDYQKITDYIGTKEIEAVRARCAYEL